MTQLVSIRLETGAELQIDQQLYPGLAKGHEACWLATGRFLRERLLKFAHYKRHAIGSRADQAAWKKIQSLEALAVDLNGKSLYHICKAIIDKRSDIESLLPGSQSKHYHWTIKFHSIIIWCTDYEKLFNPYEGKYRKGGDSIPRPGKPGGDQSSNSALPLR